jgi:asparagine N-glycosylation enzyme membrane subunit Stt3
MRNSITAVTLRSLPSRVARRARSLPETHGGPIVLIAVAVVVALGFGLRLEAALNPSVEPGEGTIVAYQGNDSKSYGEIAESLYRTGRYGTPEMRHPADWSPLAPFFYATVYRLTGGVNIEAGRAAVAMLGGLTVLFVYLLGRRLGGPAVGILAALLAAIYPTFVDNSEQILSEPSEPRTQQFLQRIIQAGRL